MFETFKFKSKKSIINLMESNGYTMTQELTHYVTFCKVTEKIGDTDIIETVEFRFNKNSCNQVSLGTVKRVKDIECYNQAELF